VKRDLWAVELKKKKKKKTREKEYISNRRVYVMTYTKRVVRVVDII
jgi:hypothetical protein